MSDETVYAVERWNWRWLGEGHLLRMPGTKRVRTFDTFDEAEEYRSRHEAAARKKINPFRCGGHGLHHWSSLDGPRFHDWLLDAGIEPPTLHAEPHAVDWVDWWDRHKGDWDDRQSAKVWEALDKVRFFEVVPTPRRPTVFVVSRVRWIYNDNWYDAEPTDGGQPVKAFRTYENAEAHRRELEAAARQEWAGYTLDDSDRMAATYDPLGNDAPPAGGEHFVEPEHAVHYEVTEIDLWEPAEAGT